MGPPLIEQAGARRPARVVDRFLGEVWVNEKGLAASASASPFSLLVAGARNHLQANRSLEFRFEIRI